MTAKEKSLAQLGTTPTDHQAQAPIDGPTVDQPTRQQLIGWINNPAAALESHPGLLLPHQHLLRAAMEAGHSALDLEADHGDRPLTAEQAAEIAGAWSRHSAACDALQAAIRAAAQ